jgi:short-subunit dehydrogenase
VNVSGRRVLITGASRGIGMALAYEFAAAGASVALAARTTAALAKVAADTGGTSYPIDLTDPRAVAEFWACVEGDGEVDVLVNNAGIDATGQFVDIDAETIDALIRVNLTTPMELTRQALTTMVPRRRGHIVNVSSLAAMIPFPGLSTYGASKAGLSRFSAGLRAELRGSGVGTTLVELGGVTTEMVDNTREFAPTRRSWSRVEKLQLSVDVDPAVVARDVVRAVERDRFTVQLPKRTRPFPWIAHAPWHITDALLWRVDRQSVDKE